MYSRIRGVESEDFCCAQQGKRSEAQTRSKITHAGTFFNGVEGGSLISRDGYKTGWAAVASPNPVLGYMPTTYIIYVYLGDVRCRGSSGACLTTVTAA